jgi:hypothetical protein
MCKAETNGKIVKYPLPGLPWLSVMHEKIEGQLERIETYL